MRADPALSRRLHRVLPTRQSAWLQRSSNQCCVSWMMRTHPAPIGALIAQVAMGVMQTLRTSGGTVDNDPGNSAPCSSDRTSDHRHDRLASPQ